MSEEKDGGPAFPQDVSYKVGEAYTDPRPQGGMTLRDYFAAKYLTTFKIYPGSATPMTAEEVAMKRYIVADAMLKERLK